MLHLRAVRPLSPNFHSYHAKQVLSLPMCEEYVKLLRGYQKAVVTFSVVVDALEAAAGASIDRQEYKRISRYAKQAHSSAERARIELKRHAADHGCFPQTSVCPLRVFKVYCCRFSSAWLEASRAPRASL